MTRYVYRNGAFRDPSTNKPMPLPERDGITMPTIRSDIEPYKSPVNGKWITTSSERRDDLARNNCVPYEPIGNMPKGVKNPEYAKKHNAMHLLTEEARDTHKISKKAIRA